MEFLTLNIDDRLLVASDGQRVVAEPGYARLGKKPAFGETAREAARLYPAEVNNRYWRNLGRMPIANPTDKIRNHADLAWLQLRKLLDGFDCDTAVVIPPSHYDDEQLSLLLGIVASLDLAVPALVQRPLLMVSAIGAGRDTRVVERQLHMSVVTTVAVADGRMTTASREVLEGTGTLDVLHRIAHFLQRRFIESTRFDPLHNAGSEQQLYDRMPGWLEQLRHESRVAIALSHADQHYPSFLTREDVRDATRDVIGTLGRALRQSDLPTLVDAETGWFLQLHGVEPETQIVIDADIDATCRKIAGQLLGFEESVLLESLDAPTAPEGGPGQSLTESGAVATPTASAGELPAQTTSTRAYAVLDSAFCAQTGDRLFLTASGSQLTATRVEPDLCLGQLECSNGELWLNPRSRDLLVNDESINARIALKPGDSIDYLPCRAGLKVILLLDNEIPSA